VVAESTPKEVAPSSERFDFFVADTPLIDPALDRFKRWPFAQRIAQTIASRRDPSSIVVGIYGTWGEGKTTVLNFIIKELEKSAHIICLRFNPWRFTDETQLLRNFFLSLADVLGKSISSKKEKIGKWLQDYATILAPISFTLGGIVQLSPAESAKEAGKTLSSIELDELRTRIEEVLKNEKKRVVIFMDDIDRLDKTEIQTVFKLLKLSADFAYTAYVVAFDEKMVAAALGEKYVSLDAQAGRIFLEKIVQVPLSLPVADRLSLRKFCFEGVDEAIKEAKAELTQEQVQAFVSHFIDGLEIRQLPVALRKGISDFLWRVMMMIQS